MRDAQESDMHQESVSSKGTVSKERTYHAKVGAHFCSHGSQPCRSALEGYVVRSVYECTDSTVVLHWIAGQRSYNQFVSSRVAQINAEAYVKWSFVGTEQNPADVGGIGTLSRQRLEIWLKGPNWLSKPQMWPAVILTKSCKETEAKA